MLYLWLNLPQRHREATFKNDFAQEELEVPHLDDIPRVEMLSSCLAKELNSINVDLETFAAKVVGNVDLFLLRNMIQTPLLWDMMSTRMKKLYMLIWNWLKQSACRRLAMLGQAPDDFLDTAHVSRQVLNQLKDWNFSLSTLISDVNKGLPSSVMSSLLHQPLDWSICQPHEKYIYLSLVEWLGHSLDDFLKDNLDVDTADIGHSSLAFIKDHNITVTEFAEKVAKFPRANVSLYFNSPVHWSRANPTVRAAFINVRFWMDQDPEQRLEKFQSRPAAVVATPKEPVKRELLPELEQEHEDDNLDEALKLAKDVVASMNLESKEAIDDFVDTSYLATEMKQSLRKSGVSIKSFSKVAQVNRNYFAHLINAPISWDRATKLQRFTYKVMQKWLLKRNCLNPAERPVLKPLNGQEFQKSSSKAAQSGSRQARVKFTPEQRQYLLEKFKENPRPNHTEKVAISKHLGVNLRTIVIFFCNRRSRFSQKTTVLSELPLENK